MSYQQRNANDYAGQDPLLEDSVLRRNIEELFEVRLHSIQLRRHFCVATSAQSAPNATRWCPACRVTSPDPARASMAPRVNWPNGPHGPVGGGDGQGPNLVCCCDCVTEAEANFSRRSKTKFRQVCEALFIFASQKFTTCTCWKILGFESTSSKTGNGK